MQFHARDALQPAGQQVDCDDPHLIAELGLRHDAARAHREALAAAAAAVRHAGMGRAGLHVVRKHSESGALQVGLVAGGDSGDGRHGVGTPEGEAGRQRGEGGSRDGPWRGSDEREQRWGRPWQLAQPFSIWVFWAPTIVLRAWIESTVSGLLTLRPLLSTMGCGSDSRNGIRLGTL